MRFEFLYLLFNGARNQCEFVTCFKTVFRSFIYSNKLVLYYNICVDVHFVQCLQVCYLQTHLAVCCRQMTAQHPSPLHPHSCIDCPYSWPPLIIVDHSPCPPSSPSTLLFAPNIHHDSQTATILQAWCKPCTNNRQAYLFECFVIKAKSRNSGRYSKRNCNFIVTLFGLCWSARSIYNTGKIETVHTSLNAPKCQ